MSNSSNSLVSLKTEIGQLQGPILVLGASGFVGGALMNILCRHRDDVIGTYRTGPAWRLDGIHEDQLVKVDLLVESQCEDLIKKTKPKTIFNCLAYGAYSFQSEKRLIHRTNYNLTINILELIKSIPDVTYVHAGSSSEYGDQAAGPLEEQYLTPNSHYAISKIAASKALYYYGTKEKVRCANLRLYSVYGPLEDSARLIPQVVARGDEGGYPPLVDPNISRDFIYVGDVCAAFVACALNLPETHWGESFNVGTGVCTTIETVAKTSQEQFQLSVEPEFSMPQRDWDVSSWYGNPEKTTSVLGWASSVSFEQGLRQTIEWYRSLGDKASYEKSSKKYTLDSKRSVTAIIACYRDAQAIPIMHERLTAVFEKLRVDYEIIFVNDNSPDDCEAVITGISAQDPRVIGINHSRAFGSQSAFRSGMEIASKNSCVLLDGDLQDPPELIESFVEKWRTGVDVVYGRRIKREAPLYMQFYYKAFYHIFDYFSSIEIPHYAGDFSLIDVRVVKHILSFPERDFFLRGVRAYAGFKQIGVDYVRPERMFGVTTNSFLKNVQWAKKAIFAYSKVPLEMMSTCGIGLFFLSVLLGIFQIVFKVFWPELTPHGVSTTILLIVFFGSINLLGISLLGEYVGKIIEEVKMRPHFIRRSIIRDGESREILSHIDADKIQPR